MGNNLKQTRTPEPPENLNRRVAIAKVNLNDHEQNKISTNLEQTLPHRVDAEVISFKRPWRTQKSPQNAHLRPI